MSNLIMFRTPLLRGGVTENELLAQVSKAIDQKDYIAAQVAIDQLLSELLTIY